MEFQCPNSLKLLSLALITLIISNEGFPMPGVKPSKKQAEEEPQVLRQGHSDFNSEITDNLAQFTSQI